MATKTDAASLDDLLRSLVSGMRGEALRAQLVARYPDCRADEIEDSIQHACKCFLSEAEGIAAAGQVYAWIRTAALRYLNREADRRRREIAIDPAKAETGQIGELADSPAEELIELEDEAELGMLVSEVSASLSDRRRDVLALYGAGYKRPQIADWLGVPERVVKRDLLAIMDEARTTLARLAGGGCDRGEPMVMRFVCGISTPDESAQARAHLSHCGRCELFSEKLIAWREKAGAMLPAPVAEGASPGVVRQVAESAGEKLSALKQHVLDGGAQVKQHATTTTYYRAVDPAPLAGARPGTAAAVIASCLAIGGGTAAYCVDQGVDPLGAAKGLIASGPEGQPDETEPPPAEPESTGPVYTPAETPVADEPAPEHQPEPQPEAQAKQQAETPPPEDSFEPVSPAYQTSEPESESSYEASGAPAPEPDPAPASSGPQFGGP